MRVKYIIVAVSNRNWSLIEILRQQKLVSTSRYKNAVIIGRYGTNKATLMRIIRREVE